MEQGVNILAHHHKVGIPIIAAIGPAGLVVAVDIPNFQGGAGDSALSLLGTVKRQPVIVVLYAFTWHWVFHEIM